MYQYNNLIDGRWVLGSGEVFSTANPAKPSVSVGQYTAATQEDVERAVCSGLVAQKAWRQLTSVERAKLITHFIDAVEAASETIAVAITAEQGKPLQEARGEVKKACDEARFMVSQAYLAHGAVMPTGRAGFSNSVIRRARGLIAALTPWNFPIMAPMRKIIPGLVFGNAVILKPSEFTPAAAGIMGDLAIKTLPKGVLQVINGKADSGQALVSDPRVNGVAFTGSVSVGKKIYRTAAENLAEVALELGGKNGAIVHDVVNLDACLDQIVTTAFQCAGQRCTGISRVIVHKPLLARVLQGLERRVRGLQLGDGMEPSTTIGPMTSSAQLEKVARLVEKGVEEGAKVLIGGKPAVVPGLESGYFYEPTLLTDVLPSMSVASEEIFGPVVCILSYEDIDEAFDVLNGVEFGLTSALFSDNHQIIQRFVRESESGMLHINHGSVPENHMPFGGIKNSGVGAYSVGPSAVNFYTTEHAVYVKVE